MAHSKEPWRRGIAYGSVVSDDGVSTLNGADHVAEYGGFLVGESICDADARRIIACVNILADVPTEILERVINAGARLSVFDDPSGGLNCDLVEASNGR